MFCSQPFYQIEIYENGDVFTCCPSFLDYFSIGNIYKNSFDEIWNGEKAQSFRKKMLSGDLSCCSDGCFRKTFHEEKSDKYAAIVHEYPTEISVSTDNGCNIACKICRDSNFPKPQKDFEEEINNLWLPIFKNAKNIRFGCSGEPFASLKEKFLIKQLAQTYPTAKFQFHTNGILGTKELLEELNVFDKIEIMTVSLHSATKPTYEKVINGGNFEKVQQNLAIYSEMKKSGLIKFFRLIFVVYSENYEDMENFVALADTPGADAQFWAYRTNDTEIGRNYEKYAIFEKSHPDYKKLEKILKSDVFGAPNVVLYPELKTIREGS